MSTESTDQSQQRQLPVAKKYKAIKLAGLIVLALIALAGIGYSVYAWQQNQTLMSSVNDRNAEIKNLNNQVGALKASDVTETNENIIPIEELGISITVPKFIKRPNL